MKTVAAALVSALLAAAPGSGAPWVDDDGSTSWAGDVASAGGTVQVEGERRTPAYDRGGSGNPRIVAHVWFVRACRADAPAAMGASGSCEFTPCETDDGLAGTLKYPMRQLEDTATGMSVGPVNVANPVCVALPVTGDDLHARVLRDFRRLPLPGVRVTTRPAGMTLVHWPTRLTAHRGWAERGMGRILGHGVTVEITPVRYEWVFGDGGTRETGPRRSVRHAYGDARRVRASVTATYRARYRVDGGSPRPIPGTVTVAGPETALDVRSARAQLVAGDD